jgi:hypothetical protein
VRHKTGLRGPCGIMIVLLHPRRLIRRAARLI